MVSRDVELHEHGWRLVCVCAQRQCDQIVQFLRHLSVESHLSHRTCSAVVPALGTKMQHKKVTFNVLLLAFAVKP